MKKRTFRLVALAVLVVVCICATTVLAACNKSSTYYLSTKSNDWTTYGKKDTVPDDVKFTLQEDGTYSLTVNLEAGDSFAIRETGKDGNLVQEIFSADTKLSLDGDGNVAVGATGSYVLNLDLSNGELSYGFTAPSPQDPTPTTVAVTGVSLNTKTLNLTVGGSDATLTATVAPTDATNQNVSWSSSAESVATVSDGTVHAVAAGDAVITVTTEDGSFTDTCNVHVSVAQSGSVAVTGVSLSPAGPINMTVGGADVTLTATVAPSDATNKNVSWSSSVPTVATVNNGVVHALAPGDTVITVTTQDGGKTATCNVHVGAAQQGGDPIPVNSIYFEEDDFSLSVGGTATLTVVVDPDNATDKSFTWSVDNEGIVRIEVSNEDDHVLNVTALTAGEVTVTLASTGTPNAESYPITITVNSVAAQSITLDPSSWTMEVGDEKNIVATVLPANATYTLTWSSDHSDIVSVDQNGHIEALATGTATITATIRGDLFATCEVEVAQHVSSISLNPSSLELYQGDDPRTISVVFNPTSATNKGFSAEITAGTGNITISDNQTAGTITVTPVAVGTATITVTSTDGGYTATCSVEVKALSDAKPYLDSSTLSVDKGNTSDSITIQAPTGITISSYTVTSAQTAIATVTKGSNNDFTVTGVKFGMTTVTVSVTYTGGSSSSTSLSLTVYVTSDFYYLTGTIDGDNWNTTFTDESAARNAGVLLEKTSDGVYELTRDIEIGSSGVKLYILPSNLGDEWANKLNKDFYSAQSNASSWQITTPDADNVQLMISGNYTIRLTLTTSGVTWTVIGNWKAPTSASITCDQTSLEYNSDTTSATFTLTIGPNGAQYDVTNIEWAVTTAAYTNWLTLTPNTSTGLTCGAQLVYFDAGTTSSVTARVTATITVGTFVVSAYCDITLMPEGASVAPTTTITWSQANGYTVNISNGWTYTVEATADGDITGVTYELVKDALGTALSTSDLLVNDVSGTVAFAINASTGEITAKMFGTIYVKATSIGVDSSGSSVYSITSVTFYASSFHLDIGWANDTGDGPELSQVDTTHYALDEVEITAGKAIVVLFDGISSDWTSVIRSRSYLDTTSDYTSGSTGNNASYSVSQTGVYKVTLDLSGVQPSVKFEYLRAISSTATFQMTVYIVGDGKGWSTSTPFASQTATLDPSSNLTITISTTASTFSSLTSWGSGIGFVTVKNGGGEDWYSSDTQQGSTTLSGNSYKTSWGTAGTWISDDNTCRVKYSEASVSKSFTFTFTFDSTGGLIKIQID